MLNFWIRRVTCDFLISCYYCNRLDGNNNLPKVLETELRKPYRESQESSVH